MHPKELAEWYEQGGYLHKNNGTMRLSTKPTGETLEEILAQLKKLGINNPRVNRTGKTRPTYRLSFTRGDTDAILEIVKPYLHIEMPIKTKRTQNSKRGRKMTKRGSRRDGNKRG